MYREDSLRDSILYKLAKKKNTRWAESLANPDVERAKKAANRANQSVEALFGVSKRHHAEQNLKKNPAGRAARKAGSVSNQVSRLKKLRAPAAPAAAAPARAVASKPFWTRNKKIGAGVAGGLALAGAGYAAHRYMSNKNKMRKSASLTKQAEDYMDYHTSLGNPDEVSLIKKAEAYKNKYGSISKIAQAASDYTLRYEGRRNTFDDRSPNFGG
jgi:hypothetical protein